MFFALSKILGFFAEPSNALIVLGLIGVALMATRRARLGRRLAVASLLLLALAGLSPLGDMLMWPLEQRFPKWDASRGAPVGAIVVGGSISQLVSGTRDDPALNEAAERLTAAVELARRYPQMRIVFSGGPATLLYAGYDEAKYAVTFLERLGVPRERIASENRSRNTFENAQFVKELVQPKPGERWLLITSAYHMPRAIGVFRAANFPVEAYPVDWRTPADTVLRPPTALSGGLRRVDTAVREWVGLLVYWATGRSSALFPAPER